MPTTAGKSMLGGCSAQGFCELGDYDGEGVGISLAYKGGYAAQGE